ncbi:DNA polymerase III subunit chi [Glaciecola punicea ACAM 611]|jgi:DNA polymerase-3 subunit chi|uniref:DNA polymerase III subunit chi n=1 Tax=Glaciecola punicea ACAM 611 TaxID=1121923 RepID=H5T8L1_9ALTE|nr:DNA polymerase III subunit chi [Glaciecola punicea]OFA30480.1 DNA polymerase III subunit chi [Glaciecola punicea]GAB54652.1 DNA polymerase III subunit chi [Glaciecola punicea ACAM 611]
MALVTFYAISEATINAHTQTDMRVNSAQNETVSAELATELAMAADLLSEYVVSRKKVTVLCASQAQAESFDDLIWQFPANKFIPHNLYGEGPDMGTPVEIIWHSAFLSMSKLRNTAVVINLSQQFIENINNIKHIIDFVPVDENEKAKARERYKKYKQAGCQLEYKSA